MPASSTYQGRVVTTNIHDLPTQTPNTLLGWSLPGTARFDATAHTYGVDWEPTYLLFYVDNNLIRTLNHNTQKPMYMILNQDMEYDTANV